jgi:hypothetical protein
LRQKIAHFSQIYFDEWTLAVSPPAWSRQGAVQ